MRIEETIADLERVAAREVGRGSEALAAPAAGGLLAAARSLAAAGAPDAAVFTGFFIPGAEPPAAETDGPLGAVQIAAALRLLGGRCRLVTDEPCAPVVEAAVAAAAPGLPVDVAPLRGYEDWAAALLPEYARLTHLIACERVGPGVDGRPRNMRGEDIGAHTAPLDRLGGTSNWAAAALVGALSLLRPEVPELRALLAPAWSYDLLTAIVRAGAVDGVRRRPTLSVDGLDWPAYAEPLTEIAELVRAGR
ncbi:glutamate cyclase domain-containing protein [Micromonospora vinacea]|uniref:glutamate cyclase domain-containing protein n=1 Tax=Micromonospora vinacea TaxID=709878 RepID=UPI00344DD146